MSGSREKFNDSTRKMLLALIAMGFFIDEHDTHQNESKPQGVTIDAALHYDSNGEIVSEWRQSHQSSASASEFKLSNNTRQQTGVNAASSVTLLDADVPSLTVAQIWLARIRKEASPALEAEFRKFSTWPLPENIELSDRKTIAQFYIQHFEQPAVENTTKQKFSNSSRK